MSLARPLPSTVQGWGEFYLREVIQDVEQSLEAMHSEVQACRLPHDSFYCHQTGNIGKCTGIASSAEHHLPLALG